MVRTNHPPRVVCYTFESWFKVFLPLPIGAVGSPLVPSVHRQRELAVARMRVLKRHREFVDI